MPKKGNFETFKFDHSLVFSWLHYSSLFLSSCFRLCSPWISPSMVAMEESRRSILLLGLYVFLYMLVKHVVDIQILFLQGEWKKFGILSLVYGSIGRKERNIWSREYMHRCVYRVLLGLRRGKESKK